MQKRTIIAGLGIAAALVAVGSTGTAVAGSLIGSAGIRDNSVRSVDIRDGGVHTNDLGAGVQAKLAKAGTLAGAVYRVANYKNGGAGDATVACADNEATSMRYTAIAGGVQAGGVQSMGQTSEFAVAGSFPGRMNWVTGEPKADRLDGWIVLGSGEWSETLKVWALCVPNTDIPVQVTDIVN